LLPRKPGAAIACGLVALGFLLFGAGYGLLMIVSHSDLDPTGLFICAFYGVIFFYAALRLGVTDRLEIESARVRYERSVSGVRVRQRRFDRSSLKVGPPQSDLQRDAWSGLDAEVGHPYMVLDDGKARTTFGRGLGFDAPEISALARELLANLL